DHLDDVREDERRDSHGERGAWTDRERQPRPAARVDHSERYEHAAHRATDRPSPSAFREPSGDKCCERIRVEISGRRPDEPEGTGMSLGKHRQTGQTLE